MHILWIISCSLLLLYIIRILSYHAGWKRLQTIGYAGEEFPGVSVVVPVRNEAENIGRLLKDLLAQDYPSGKYEIILVDDHSSDDTRTLIENFRESNPEIRLLFLSPAETGKKAALKTGIEASVHPLILNTDGDCRASSGWIAKMTSGFMDPGIRMIISTVILDPPGGIAGSLQSLEFFSHMAISAGSAGLNDPILCTAANMAYLKDDYLSFIRSTKKQSESGDDIFLLLWLKKKYPGSVRFVSSPDAVIRTFPVGSPSEFFSQRMRWTSKIRYYRDVHIISTAALIFGLNIFLAFLFCAGILHPLFHGSAETNPFMLFLGLLAGKSITDFILLFPVLNHYNKLRLLWYFLPLELIYFMYVSLTGIFGQILAISWKGRRIDAS